MTFHRAILVSFAIHALVCGGALAFAQYGYISGMRSDTIMVSLVGAGTASQDRAHDHERLSVRGAAEHPVSVKKSEQARMDAWAADRPVQSHGSDSEPMVRKNTGEAGLRFGILTPDQWQLIQAALERAKSYPRMARERGIEGVVHVRFKVLPSGGAEHVEILKSSGHEVLDSATVRTVYRAGPLPHVTGWVEVPIAYVLK